MRNVVVAALGIDPEKLLQAFGTAGLLAIVFAESGLFFGFFLPGDSLLFAAGLFSARGDLPSILVIAVGCAAAAIAGDQVGYAFGNKVGPALFRRPDSRVFKQEYVGKAEHFFEHHGSKAIVLARFVPIVRTFTPIVAGASKMDYRRFVSFNVIGGVFWGAGFTTLGWALGSRFPWMVERIEYIAIIIVLLSVLPIGIELLRHRRRSQPESVPADEAA
ncbi:MAG: VTT domain-containing protein [Acidimicrobiales bacterium]|nr:VTT domain-containing protein [Acidimicrobiales bacterium]